MYTQLKVQNEVKVETAVIKETVSFIQDCVKFWNREGAQIYVENLLGNLGTKGTNKEAKDTVYTSWILNKILTDIKGKVRKYPAKLKVGRTSSHVFVHTLEGNEERFLMLHV